MSSAYVDPIGKLNIVIIPGKQFGPMRLTPEVAESIAGRTYSAAVYGAKTGVKVADFAAPTIADAAAGIIELTMEEAETGKLTPGTGYGWSLDYVEGADTKTAFAGFAEALKPWMLP